VKVVVPLAGSTVGDEHDSPPAGTVTHIEPMHGAPPAHGRKQPPQCKASVRVSTHSPSHSVSGGVHIAMQNPSTLHVEPSSHVPHVPPQPSLPHSRSVQSGTHPPRQSLSLHVCSAVQARKQVPQWLRSLDVFTQRPSQSVSPIGQPPPSGRGPASKPPPPSVRGPASRGAPESKRPGPLSRNSETGRRLRVHPTRTIAIETEIKRREPRMELLGPSTPGRRCLYPRRGAVALRLLTVASIELA
jgi:hypothetical protein